ncbi:MAG: hypothetical protein LN588_03055 [Rickettsia endosymbiont of Bryobia graminum]|nr:hypothetical protein [Rickettsia endosymbiont of Bryobia graminum]
MFIVHTETINGKGVLDLYKQLKSRNHDIKIAVIPLLVKNNEVLYDLDVNFANKFESSDVIFPCGTQKPYKTCSPISQKFDYIFVHNPYNLSKSSALDPYFTLEGLKKITHKLAYIVYGPHLFHQDTYNKDTYNSTDLKKLIDVAFVDSESTKKIFIEHFNFKPNNIQVSGYQNYKNVRELSKQQKKVENSPETILWLPRWTLNFRYRDLHEGGSTFLSYYHFFIIL